jgi:hypothetical protein
MALKKSINFKGIEIKDAYIRISRFDGDKNTLSFGVSFHSDPNAQAFDNKTYLLNDAEAGVVYVLDGDNPIKQAYQFLKTLPEFAGAVDC